MPYRYINRGGIHQEELNQKFEILKETHEILESELEKRRKFDPLLDKLVNNPKILELIPNLIPNLIHT